MSDQERPAAAGRFIFGSATQFITSFSSAANRTPAFSIWPFTTGSAAVS
jgi:hypothetical protein